MTEKKRFYIASVLSLVLGLLIWFFSALLFGANEPWDNSIFNYIIILSIIGLFGGFVAGKHFWLWPLWLIIGQIIGIFIHNIVYPTVGANFFIPIGLLFLIIYAIPAFITSLIGVKLNKFIKF